MGAIAMSEGVSKPRSNAVGICSSFRFVNSRSSVQIRVSAPLPRFVLGRPAISSSRTDRAARFPWPQCSWRGRPAGWTRSSLDAAVSRSAPATRAHRLCCGAKRLVALPPGAAADSELRQADEHVGGHLGAPVQDHRALWDPVAGGARYEAGESISPCAGVFRRAGPST